MTMHETDPRDIGFIALYIAIKKWHKPISPETALRIARGASHAKPPEKMSQVKYREIKKILVSPNFKNLDSVQNRFKVNKYEILKMLGEEMFGEETTDEGVINIMRIDIILKKLKEEAENCNAANCEKCFLDSDAGNGLTWCEVLCDMQFDEHNRPIKTIPGSNVEVEKFLTGETKAKVYRIYEDVLKKLDNYLDKNKKAKIQDVISEALLRYLVREERLEKIRGSK